jgi:hypothetical protein
MEGRGVKDCVVRRSTESDCIGTKSLTLNTVERLVQQQMAALPPDAKHKSGVGLETPRFRFSQSGQLPR